MAEQYYAVGDINHGGTNGVRYYRHGEAFDAASATEEQLAELRATGALKTAAELATTGSNTSDIIAAKDAEIDALRAQLLEANTAKGRSKKSPDEMASEVS